MMKKIFFNISVIFFSLLVCIIDTKKSSFWKLFRLNFVLFSLYLMGDVFFRWDGFSYYASFSEFIPAIALVSILWSLVAFSMAVILWLSYKAVEGIFSIAEWNIDIEHFTLGLSIFVLLGLVFWIGKLYVLPDFHSFGFKIIVFFILLLVAGVLAWIFHKKSGRLIHIIQERITPLVWLFGLIAIFSMPVVAYHTWIKETDSKANEQILSRSGANKDRPNFILVTFDALTARNMSSNGYHRETTPFISEWAKSATSFEWTEAASNATAPTLTSLKTGKRVWNHQAYYLEGFKTKENNDNLAQVLKNNGYHTRVYMGNRFTTPKNMGMESSYDFIHSFQPWRLMSFSVLGILDEFLHHLFIDKIPLYNWIIKEDFLLFKILWVTSPGLSKVYAPFEAFNDFINAMETGGVPEPYFVWFHFYPPHDAYLPPAPYMGMYNSSPKLRNEKSQATAVKTIRREYGKNVNNDYLLNLLRDRYDECIRFCDKQFENFIRRLDKNNISSNTVIILSADHGESFEHGYIKHGRKELYEHVTHIPLFIKEQDQSEGAIIKDMVRQIDIPATILELAGVPIPPWMEGRSLVPLMNGIKLTPEPAFSMTLETNRPREKLTKGTVAVWEGDYKLIYYLDENRSLLFNLREDPDELHNLLDREPKIGAHLLTLIKNNLEKANKRITSGG